MRLIITARASEDLSAITEFGSERWGEDAARRYADLIRGKLVQLTIHPEMGMVDEQHQDFRRLSAGSHVAFYKIWGDDVLVVRVLHSSQEPGRHLP